MRVLRFLREDVRNREVVKRQPIGGASDTGRATMLLIGVICSVCGYVVGAGWYEQQYQQDWHDHARLRELMGHRRNFLEQLDHLERLQGAPQHERRLRLLEAELETLDVRRSLLLSEKRGLEENLGLLRGRPESRPLRASGRKARRSAR